MKRRTGKEGSDEKRKKRAHRHKYGMQAKSGEWRYSFVSLDVKPSISSNRRRLFAFQGIMNNLSQHLNHGPFPSVRELSRWASTKFSNKKAYQTNWLQPCLRSFLTLLARQVVQNVSRLGWQNLIPKLVFTATRTHARTHAHTERAVQKQVRHLFHSQARLHSNDPRFPSEEQCKDKMSQLVIVATPCTQTART